MARIFISYKREDKDVVFKIKDDIEKHVGEKCWIDLDGIKSDAQFVNVIINAIDEAEIFLFMYSKKHAEITDFEIDWTIREINYAQTEGKRIIFLNLDRTPLSKWFKMMFGLKQQVDVHSNVAMNKLYADLRKWLDNGSEGSEISLKSDLDCRVYKDGLEWCGLRKGENKVVLLQKGNYKLKFVSIENSADYYEEDYVVEENNIKKSLNISLLPIKEKREKEEKLKNDKVLKDIIVINFKNVFLVSKRVISKYAVILPIVVMLLGLLYVIYNEFSSGGGEENEPYIVEEARYVEVESDEMKEKINGHEYVDLGLSVKWATCNVGATKPEELGDYFAWGETTTKTDYSWATYKYCKGAYATITKYCNDSSSGYKGFTDIKKVLDLIDDAAYVNWRKPWRMPTRVEIAELQQKCTWKLTIQNGVVGYKVTGYTGNFIFLPLAGYMYGTSLYSVGSVGRYWSSSYDHGHFAFSMNSYSDGVTSYAFNKDRGFSVRPVCP